MAVINKNSEVPYSKLNDTGVAPSSGGKGTLKGGGSDELSPSSGSHAPRVSHQAGKGGCISALMALFCNVKKDGYEVLSEGPDSVEAPVLENDNSSHGFPPFAGGRSDSSGSSSSSLMESVKSLDSPSPRFTTSQSDEDKCSDDSVLLFGSYQSGDASEKSGDASEKSIPGYSLTGHSDSSDKTPNEDLPAENPSGSDGTMSANSREESDQTKSNSEGTNAKDDFSDVITVPSNVSDFFETSNKKPRPILYDVSGASSDGIMTVTSDIFRDSSSSGDEANANPPRVINKIDPSGGDDSDASSLSE